MKKYITFLILFPVLSSQAGWDTNAWPAWQHPRNTYYACLAITSGIVERASFTIGTNNLDLFRSPTAIPPPERTNHFYRFQRQNLIYAKKFYIKQDAGWNRDKLINYFVYPTASNSYGIATEWEGFSSISLLAKAHMPTNYFDYTPYRYLSGLGHFTNDASVGHPYGWTNEYTVKGGTNFPAGRSQWYTTDYGWDGMTNVLNLLRYTQPYIAYTSGGKVVDPGDTFSDGCGYTTNYYYNGCANTNAGVYYADTNYPSKLSFKSFSWSWQKMFYAIDVENHTNSPNNAGAWWIDYNLGWTYVGCWWDKTNTWLLPRAQVYTKYTNDEYCLDWGAGDSCWYACLLTGIVSETTSHLELWGAGNVSTSWVYLCTNYIGTESTECLDYSPVCPISDNDCYSYIYTNYVDEGSTNDMTIFTSGHHISHLCKCILDWAEGTSPMQWIDKKQTDGWW